MKRLILGNFDRIDAFSKENRNKLDAIVFDWSTLKFFTNSTLNFTALYDMLKPGGMLIIPSTMPASCGINSNFLSKDRRLNDFSKIFSGYGVSKEELMNYPDEYKKRIHNRVNNMVIKMLTHIGFECSLGVTETLKNNVALNIILQHPMFPKESGPKDVLIATKNEY